MPDQGSIKMGLCHTCCCSDIEALGLGCGGCKIYSFNSELDVLQYVYIIIYAMSKIVYNLLYLSNIFF